MMLDIENAFEALDYDYDYDDVDKALAAIESGNAYWFTDTIAFEVLEFEQVEN